MVVVFITLWVPVAQGEKERLGNQCLQQRTMAFLQCERLLHKGTERQQHTDQACTNCFNMMKCDEHVMSKAVLCMEGLVPSLWRGPGWFGRCSFCIVCWPRLFLAAVACGVDIFCSCAGHVALVLTGHYDSTLTHPHCVSSRLSSRLADLPTQLCFESNDCECQRT